jgi:hypothetical protein
MGAQGAYPPVSVASGPARAVWDSTHDPQHGVAEDREECLIRFFMARAWTGALRHCAPPPRSRLHGEPLQVQRMAAAGDGAPSSVRRPCHS